LNPELYVGALSGTSVDGIDAALVRFSPEPVLVASHTLPYPEVLRQELLALGVPGANEIDRLGAADVEVGRCFAQAVLELMERAGVVAQEVCAVGSHGQTIRHRPGAQHSTAFTLQVGDPNVIAAGTGIPVVADFRRKDVALGGQGAPLVPAFHDAVFRQRGKDRVVVNIGGIANLTVLPGDPDSPIAGFDTGPGNTLMDAWSRRVLNQPMDLDGAWAASGRVHGAGLQVLLADPYFTQAPPKSTGPEYFSLAWLDRHWAQGTRPADADVQATLLALTTASIVSSIGAFPDLHGPEVFVCGGGGRNRELMRSLTGQLPGCTLALTDALGVPAGWVEAMAFAWLAFQRVHGRPGNSPQVTGAKRPAVLGGLWLPD
jgi:anhydro-N-acetylmuramic acid kinase